MNENNGIASVRSAYSVEETLARLKSAVTSKGLQIFAQIDHRAGAEQVGLQMQPAQVLIFGTAKAGTPLMVASPLLALDLPLKVLVWQDAQGVVWASYNTTEFLVKRHRLPSELAKYIAGIEGLVRAAAG